jgi:ABC-type polysaccharide/polyol phosphate export permease
MNNFKIFFAIADISKAIKTASLAGKLGWQDVKQRYRRSSLGPFWLTISMGVMIGTIGIVFGQIFDTPMQDFLPFLAAGMILWAFIATIVTEGCTVFINAESIIKQLPIPLFVHIMRMMWRNTLILGHNIVILPLVLLLVGKSISPLIFLSVPGFLFLAINLAWLSLLLGVICARYRDFPQIIGSILQVVFYLTPIMWLPNLLPKRAGLYLLDLNPMYHVIEVVRAPLLGVMPTATNWIVTVGLCVVGWVGALLVYGRYRMRIAYWL